VRSLGSGDFQSQIAAPRLPAVAEMKLKASIEAPSDEQLDEKVARDQDSLVVNFVE